MEDKKVVEAKDRIILALDVDTIEEVEKYVGLLKDYVGYFKVGLQLFTSCGFEAVEIIKKNGGKVYFDGKFQDIPNTIAQTSINLMKRGVDFFNISATGGSKMMAAALEGLTEGSTGKRPVLIAVTQLTSTSKEMMNTEQLIPGEVIDSVVNYAKVAKASGLDGIVCSPLEVAKVKEVSCNG